MSGEASSGCGRKGCVSWWVWYIIDVKCTTENPLSFFWKVVVGEVQIQGKN